MSYKPPAHLTKKGRVPAAVLELLRKGACVDRAALGAAMPRERTAKGKVKPGYGAQRAVVSGGWLLTMPDDTRPNGGAPVILAPMHRLSPEDAGAVYVLCDPGAATIVHDGLGQSERARQFAMGHVPDVAIRVHDHIAFIYNRSSTKVDVEFTRLCLQTAANHPVDVRHRIYGLSPGSVSVLDPAW